MLAYHSRDHAGRIISAKSWWLITSLTLYVAPAFALLSFQLAVILCPPVHLFARPTAIDPPLNGPANTNSVGCAEVQASEAVIGGGCDGCFGGDIDGAVAKQNGTSTWSNQSEGAGGAGGVGGGDGSFVHVCHLGSMPMEVILDCGLK